MTKNYYLILILQRVSKLDWDKQLLAKGTQRDKQLDNIDLTTSQ